ncbi:MAG: lysine exporter LysO family protein [Lentihominibacter sp.]|jgi:uncharacterized membrane protein YbjE (DUF340 family)
MTLLLIYWTFLVIGYVIADRLRKTDINFSWVQPALMWTIYILCFVMGLRMGVNKDVTGNLGTIGVMALVIALACIGGSMFAVFIMRLILKIDRYGNLKGAEEDVSTEAIASENNGSNAALKSTVIILALIVGGMLFGALVIAKKYSYILSAFDEISNMGLIVLLCILLLLVGFEVGKSGTLITTLRQAGFRVLAFPIAAVLGTVVFGVAACMLMGFTARVGGAICMGFGWYTYAPVVIAKAGSRFMVASAVAFMYNVIREVTGIVFIPVIAKKIGYIEATAVPGVAAMDICMPIVERSCRPDTVVYSFTMGAIMCLATSIGVPLLMG